MAHKIESRPGGNVQLIRKIEINYLRSLYRASLDQPGDLNIIFGRNDSGKSNLLRALNLFFNGEAETDHDLDFSLDFSDIRKSEAKETKGKQFIAIRIDFNVPESYRKSLGEIISIKRQWNIYGEMNETPPKDLSKGSRIQLTRFMNQVDFTYIPAIKDISVFSDLIGRVYASAASSRSLQGATDIFVQAIRDQTQDLSASLSNLFKYKTSVAAPTDMELMFRSLDFSHGDDNHSLLRQKGDGIKARHLPELLRFINHNESGKKYFLWGFEEPENSLDFGAAEAEAANFAEISSRTDTQVFITSHSPAFYLAECENKSHSVRRIFISKQIPAGGAGNVVPKNAISIIDDLEQAEEKMKEASLLQLPYLIRKWKDLQDDNAKHQSESAKLRGQLDALRIPTLFVEGKTEKIIFEDAFSRAGIGSNSISVRPLDGTPRTTSALIPKISDGLSTKAPVVFLFDNDIAGRSAYKNICDQPFSGGEPHKISAGISAWALPVSTAMREFANRYTIQDNQMFITLEFLYPGDEAARLCYELMSDEQKSESDTEIHDNFHKGLSQKNSQPLRAASPGTRDWLWARGVPENLKTRFASKAMKSLDPGEIDLVAKRVLAELAV